jgi:hypothetical protein
MVGKKEGGRLSVHCPDDLQGKAEWGFISGSDFVLQSGELHR